MLQDEEWGGFCRNDANDEEGPTHVLPYNARINLPGNWGTIEGKPGDNIQLPTIGRIFKCDGLLVCRWHVMPKSLSGIRNYIGDPVCRISENEPL